MQVCLTAESEGIDIIVGGAEYDHTRVVVLLPREDVAHVDGVPIVRFFDFSHKRDIFPVLGQGRDTSA